MSRLFRILFLLMACLASVATARPPNFVVIFTDDQGYADLGCFGGTHVKTPRIDQMATEGAKLTSFYVAAPVCTPSRAALMTGCYPKRIDMATGSNFGVLLAGDRKGLHPEEITIAEVLKAAGYKTGMFGKWHLGDQPEFLPTRQGFDEVFGIPFSHDIHPFHPAQKHFRFPSLPLLEGETVIEMDPDADYLTQRFTERAVQFIEKNKDQPFFLYLPHPIPHKPLHVSPPFAKDVPEEIKATLSRENNRIDYQTRNKLFPQAIREIDWSVGQVLDALKKHGIDDNTLVIFTSDNGPAIGKATPLKGRKGSTFEGGMREATVIRWPGRIPAGTVNDELMTAMDLLPTFAKLAGANVPSDRVIDGRDIWPVLAGNAKSPHQAFFYHGGNHLKAVRSGKWKLHVAAQGKAKGKKKGKGAASPALYNLEEDIGETTDVAKNHPKVVERLRGYMAAFEQELAQNSRPAGFVENPKPLTKATPSPANPAHAAATRPNILIIFTDDQGYADLGCFGSPENQTPGLDQLAKDGTKFTSFYAQPVCGPSRSALLTGRYPALSKGWGMPASEITFAEMLKEVGYQTACVGKWDVSSRQPIIGRMPNAQGFDYYYGTLGGNGSGKIDLYENNKKERSTEDMACLTRLYTDKALDFLENQRDPEKPFILYLAHTMTHTVIDASPQFKEKTGDNLYRAVVEELDYETGRLLDTLDQLGLRENTLVIYTSDNGPWNQPLYYNGGAKNDHPAHSIFWGDAGEFRDGKASIWEGGAHVPCIMRWPGKIPAGKTNDGLMATIDFLPTFAALTGAKVPDDRVIDGVNQLDFIYGKSETARETYLYNPGSASVQTRLVQGNAIREGDWKLISPLTVGWFLEDAGTGDWELYNLKDDIGETKNLAAQCPEKVERLKKLLKASEAKLPKQMKPKQGGKKRKGKKK